ncbi:MAG: hypothetical protein QOD06_324 [Candidatus Binatota bacterium]|jgi:hypothetical protein|nr:hypothetical protein [Candidatus Binatota bacterium]
MTFAAKTCRWMLAGTLMLMLPACEKKGPAEEAGEKIDDAAEKAGDAVEETGEAIKDKMNGH